MKTSEKAFKFAKALVTGTLDFEYSGTPCRLEHASWKKLLTVARTQVNCSRAKPSKPWYPVQLHVETSAVCSLHCPLCPAGMGLTGTNRSIMPFATFRDLMDEVGDYTLSALMWGWGEPLLNPKLADMIDYACGKNVVTVVSTNGQWLRSEDDAERLVSAGLDCLIVSMDGATQDVYSRYRVGGEVERVTRCLELIRDAKTRLRSHKPVVNVQTVVLKHNEHELAQIADTAHRCGAELVTRVSSHMPDYAGQDADERFAPDDERYRRFEYGDGKRLRRSATEYACIRPWDRMTVTWDGTVIACEHDFKCTLPLGRGGNGGSFLDAWWGEPASELRRQLLLDKTVYPFCNDCHYRDNKQQCLVDVLRPEPMHAQ